jgi:hypothetical protein
MYWLDEGFFKKSWVRGFQTANGRDALLVQAEETMHWQNGRQQSRRDLTVLLGW